MVLDDPSQNDKITRISSLLKRNPKGLTITEISKRLNISRISAARNLDVLLVSGKVEMKTYGRAKVFYVSSRVPISAMLSYSSDFIVILNRSLHILQINDAFCKFLGVERKDLVGQAITIEPLKFLEQLSLPSFSEEGEVTQEMVSEISTMKNEKLCYFETKILPTVFDDGSLGITVILQDITERKLAEQIRAFISSIVENSYDAIISKDLEGTILSWNRAAELMYGYQAHEIIGRSVSLLIPDNQKEDLVWILDLIKKGEVVPSFETRRKKKSGEIINVNVTISPIRNNVGDIIAISVIARDLSMVKSMEEEIRIKGEKLNEIIEFLPDATVVLNRDNTIMGWNRVLEEFTGIKKETIIGRSFSEIKAIYGTNRPMLVELLDKSDDEISRYYPGASRLGNSIVTEIFLDKRRDGKGIHLFVKATPLYDNTGNYIGAIEIFRDISGWKTMENSLIASYKKVVDELEMEIKNLRLKKDTLLKESYKNPLETTDQPYQLS